MEQEPIYCWASPADVVNRKRGIEQWTLGKLPPGEPRPEELEAGWRMQREEEAGRAVSTEGSG